MKKLYVSALYEKKETGEVFPIHYFSTSCFKEDKLRYAHCLENSGFKMTRCFITTDRYIYWKNRLNMTLLSFKSFCETSYQQLEDLESNNSTCLDETRACILDIQESYMRRIAHMTRRCLNYDIEVTDEVALQCFDWYQMGKEIV